MSNRLQQVLTQHAERAARESMIEAIVRWLATGQYDYGKKVQFLPDYAGRHPFRK